MDIGGRPVEADTDSPNSRLSDFLGNALINEGAVRGQGDGEALLGRERGDFKDVRATEGFSPAQDDQGRSDGGEILEKVKSFSRRQLAYPGILLGQDATVAAV
jgi:hypothetical protein